MSVSATVTTSRSLLSEGNAAALAALRDALGSGATVSDRELDRMALAITKIGRASCRERV